MLYAVKSATCLVLASLAVSDLRFRRLPTRAVLVVAGLYWIDATIRGAGVASFAAHLAAAVAAFALFALLFRCGWMGGGDVKLAAAVFLWAGPAFAWPVYFVISSCGLVLGLTMLLIDRYRGRGSRREVEVNAAAIIPTRGVPYGVALALGGVAAVWLPALNPL